MTDFQITRGSTAGNGFSEVLGRVEPDRAQTLLLFDAVNRWAFNLPLSDYGRAILLALVHIAACRGELEVAIAKPALFKLAALTGYAGPRGLADLRKNKAVLVRKAKPGRGAVHTFELWVPDHIRAPFGLPPLPAWPEIEEEGEI